VSLPFSLILIFCECTPLQPNDKPRDPRIKIEYSLSFSCGFSDSLVVGFFFGYGCASRDSSGNDGLVVGSSGDFLDCGSCVTPGNDDHRATRHSLRSTRSLFFCLFCIAAMKRI
jgi:hypothetical protein